MRPPCHRRRVVSFARRCTADYDREEATCRRCGHEPLLDLTDERQRAALEREDRRYQRALFQRCSAISVAFGVVVVFALQYVTGMRISLIGMLLIGFACASGSLSLLHRLTRDKRKFPFLAGPTARVIERA